MVKNEFTLTSYRNIPEVYLDKECQNSLVSNGMVGNVALEASIGYLQLGINDVSRELVSIDGLLGKIEDGVVSLNGVSNAPLVGLMLSNEREFLRGVGYEFDMGGNAIYDRGKQSLFLGEQQEGSLAKIGLNTYALLDQGVADNKYRILGLLITPIEIK